LRAAAAGTTTATPTGPVAQAEGSADSIQASSTFSDGLFQELEDSEGSEAGDVFDGAALIDPQGRKKYLVARESTGLCVCSNDLSAAFVQEDAPVNLQATLTAPPEDVTRPTW
jgi:hypothetical protein